MESNQYSLEKSIWSDQDFEQMGWHDNYIHAFAALPENFELLFDLDYILQWVAPAPTDTYYQFWVAPATLVFNNVADVEIQISSQLGEFTLQALSRSDAKPTPNGKFISWLWVLDGNEGEITFRATGYKQYFRRSPILVKTQSLDYEERGGIDFSRNFQDI